MGSNGPALNPTMAVPVPVEGRTIRSAREQAPCRLAEPRLARRSVDEASQGLHQIGGRGRSAQLLTDQHTGHRPELLAQERLELRKEFRGDEAARLGCVREPGRAGGVRV